MRAAYTEEQVSQALAGLAANGGDVEATAKLCGIPASTLRSWAKGVRRPELRHSPLVREKKRSLDISIGKFASRLLGELNRTFRDMTPPQMVVALGIAVDKMVALRTSGILDRGHNSSELANKTDAELKAELAHYERINREGDGAKEGLPIVAPVQPVDDAKLSSGPTPPSDV